MRQSAHVCIRPLLVIAAALGVTFVSVAAVQVASADPPRRVEIRVDRSGFHPATVQAVRDEPVVLVFTRTEDRGCGREVVVPSQNIRRPLPLNEPVEIRLSPSEDGRIAFTCGMGHLRGAVVVEPPR